MAILKNKEIENIADSLPIEADIQKITEIFMIVCAVYSMNTEQIIDVNSNIILHIANTDHPNEIPTIH